jgi:hypothetical protein
MNQLLGGTSQVFGRSLGFKSVLFSRRFFQRSYVYSFLPFPPFVHFDNILVVITHWYHACGWLAAAAECLLDIETLVCSGTYIL